eukprot:2514388-Prymnesium_polylepis.1
MPVPGRVAATCNQPRRLGGQHILKNDEIDLLFAGTLQQCVDARNRVVMPLGSAALPRYNDYLCVHMWGRMRH